MILEEIKILKHKSTGAKKFGYWIFIRDQGKRQGIAARKSAIAFFTGVLGPMGIKWQYQKYDSQDYILKLNDEKDFLFFLLRLK